MSGKSFRDFEIIYKPLMLKIINVIFFFQAEDGIRDLYVTGVQTCALLLDGGADSQRRWPVFRRGADHRASVVNRQRRPQPKLALAHMQREANRWKEEQRNRI